MMAETRLKPSTFRGVQGGGIQPLPPKNVHHLEEWKNEIQLANHKTTTPPKGGTILNHYCSNSDCDVSVPDGSKPG